MRRSLALALAVTVLAPTVAAAQDKDRQRASELVKQAIAKSQAGDHDEAVELYEDAYKIIPQPLLLSNIGSEYQALEKPVEALKYFCKYLEAEPNGSNAGFVKAQAKTLHIELSGEPDVDEDDVCKPIVKAPPEDTPGPGGGNTSSPEPTPDSPEPTTHSKASPVRWVGVGVGVLGAGAFGLGVVYGMKARTISSDISNHDPNVPWPGNIRQLEADGTRYEKKQIAFMIGGGVAIAAGVTLFFIGGPKARTDGGAQVSLTPVATTDTLGVAASGRF